MRVGVVITSFVCCACCLISPVGFSYADTIYLRNGKKYPGVTIVEQTETHISFRVSDGAVRVVSMNEVSAFEEDGRWSSPERELSKNNPTRGRRPVHGFMNQQGIPIITNVPDRYSGPEYEEILKRLEPIGVRRRRSVATDEILRRALSEATRQGLRPRQLPGRLAHELNSLIRTYAHRYRVRPELVKAIIHVESNFDPNARSDKGAMGLMQLMPRTASAMGITDAYDIEQNIAGGTQYFKRLLDMFGSERLAIAAYNAGPGAVKRYGDIPPYEETRMYVPRVLRYASLYGREMISPL